MHHLENKQTRHELRLYAHYFQKIPDVNNDYRLGGLTLDSSSAQVESTGLRPRQRDSGAIDYVRPTRTNDQLSDEHGRDQRRSNVAPGGRPREEGAAGGENAKISKSARINKINSELNISFILCLSTARARVPFHLPTLSNHYFRCLSVVFSYLPLPLSSIN